MPEFKKPESLEKINLKKRLEDAVYDQDIDNVLALLKELDAILIGEKTVYSLPESYKQEIEEFFIKEDGAVKIYLGDGGLSRLIISKDRGKIEIFLGGNSTEKVKKMWKEI